MRSIASLLLPLVILSGCTGSTSPGDATPSAPPPATQAQSESRPAQCSGTVPTRFADGVPDDIVSSVVTTDASGATLVGTDLYVDEVVVDSGLLYWTLLGAQDGRIVTAPVGQGASAVVVDETGEGSPVHLAVQGGRLVWLEVSAGNSSLSRVMRAATDGWDPHPLSSFEPIVDIAYDAAAAYVVEDDAVVRVDLETGARTTLASEPGASVDGVAVDDADVYFESSPSSAEPSSAQVVLARVPKAGGTVTTVSTQKTYGAQVPPGGIASSGMQTYWSVGGYPTRILSAPDDASACASIATTEGTASMLRPQGDSVYFTSWDLPTPSMYRMPAQGGTPTLVVPMIGTAGYPTPGYEGTASRGAIALDGTNVYFGGFDGSLAPAIFCVAE
jgi:hypothetical protein